MAPVVVANGNAAAASGATASIAAAPTAPAPDAMPLTQHVNTPTLSAAVAAPAPASVAAPAPAASAAPTSEVRETVAEISSAVRDAASYTTDLLLTSRKAGK